MISALLIDGVGNQKPYQLHAPIPSVQVPLRRLCLWNNKAPIPQWEPIPVAEFFLLGKLPSGVFVYAMKPWQLWWATMTHTMQMIWECKTEKQKLSTFYALDEELERQIESQAPVRRVVLYDAAWKVNPFLVRWERWGVGWRAE
jgi:hypothetical protein